MLVDVSVNNFWKILEDIYIVNVLGRKEGYTVKYTPLAEGVPKGEARGNS